MRIKTVPGGNFGWPGGQLRALGKDAHGQLPAIAFLPHPVPPLVEPALEAGDIVGGCLMRGMGGAGRIIDQEGLVGRGCLLVVDIADDLVGQSLVEQVALILLRRDPADPPEQGGEY